MEFLDLEESFGSCAFILGPWLAYHKPLSTKGNNPLQLFVHLFFTRTFLMFTKFGISWPEQRKLQCIRNKLYIGSELSWKSSNINLTLNMSFCLKANNKLYKNEEIEMYFILKARSQKRKLRLYLKKLHKSLNILTKGLN